MGWELFQHIEETRCGMFEPKLAAERKVSFERDGLDTSKACHISARGNVRSRAAGEWKRRARRENCRSVISRCCFGGLLPSQEPRCSFLSALSSRVGGAN